MLCFLGFRFAIDCYLLILSIAVDTDDVIEWQINLLLLASDIVNCHPVMALMQSHIILLFYFVIKLFVIGLL